MHTEARPAAKSVVPLTCHTHTHLSLTHTRTEARQQQGCSTTHLSGPGSCPCRTPACCQALRWTPPGSARPTIPGARARARLPLPPATPLRGHTGPAVKSRAGRPRNAAGPEVRSRMEASPRQARLLPPPYAPTLRLQPRPFPAAHTTPPNTSPCGAPSSTRARHRTSRARPHRPKFPPDSAYNLKKAPPQSSP